MRTKQARSASSPRRSTVRSAAGLTPRSVAGLIRRYAAGPALIRKALAKVPAKAVDWKPGPGRWSVREVVAHCADSEVIAHARLRYVLAEETPTIVAYDQDVWAGALRYDRHPLGLALATVTAVRDNTVPLLRSLPMKAWTRKGRHTETGAYTAGGWLRAYAEHLEAHARQIDRNVAAFRASS